MSQSKEHHNLHIEFFVLKTIHDFFPTYPLGPEVYLTSSTFPVAGSLEPYRPLTILFAYPLAE